jgi:membrane fusion protein (multidrug efflux system)
VLVQRVLHDAVVIPQRASFKVEDKTYVYVIDKEDVLHRREIVVQNQLDGVFVVKTGLDGNDMIVLAGVPQVCDGEKVEYAVEHPKQALPE